MTDIDYWIAKDLITKFNILSFIAILFSIYIYEIKELIKYIREQKQPWHKRFLT